jgi:hypothetical protein
MAEHPLWMLVGMALMVLHPTQLADLLSVGDATWTLMSISIMRTAMSILSMTMFTTLIFYALQKKNLLPEMMLITFHPQFVLLLTFTIIPFHHHIHFKFYLTLVPRIPILINQHCPEKSFHNNYISLILCCRSIES